MIKDKRAVVGVNRICNGKAGYVDDIQGDTNNSETKNDVDNQCKLSIKKI